LGLVSMEERVHLVGGDVRVVTRLRMGTWISVRVPIGARVNRDTRDVDMGMRVHAFQHTPAERP
jgi:signal transduction histidine kinase